MKAVTLFSGIGGFDIALEGSGVDVVGVCEIDKNAQSVLRRHFPKAELFDDVKKVGVNTHAKGTIDIICGGFPCQDLSIAGKRKGLDGERSGLWYEFARVIDELEPQWVVIENVPGLLSSNKGGDIQIIIDTLTQMGYTCDVDIKDAQEFGVAQRRRRVFIVCVRLDGLLSKRTNLSKQVSADLLAQILLHTWGAIQPVSCHVALHSDFGKPIERCVNLLNKMTGLLNKTQERLASKKYQNNLDVLLDQFGGEGKNLMSGSIKKSGIQKEENSGKTVMLLSDLRAANGGMSISLWLNNLLEGVCEMERVSTTSTSKNLITDHQIYIYSAMVLLIIERILLSTEWSLSYWNAAHFFSILIQENMNYARTASNELFIESGLRDSWRDYLNSASDIKSEIDNRIRNIRAAEILFEPESLSGIDKETKKARNTHSAADTIRNRENIKPIIWEMSHANDVCRVVKGEIFPTLQARMGLGGNQVPMVGIRRLTPLECERLQGFTSIKETIIIDVCLDRQKNSVSVEIQSRKSQKHAESVGKIGLSESAPFVEMNTNTNDQPTNKPAQPSVLINCEERKVEILSQGKLLLSASFAEDKNLFPLLTQSEDFALLLAGLNTILAQITQRGREALHLNEKSLTVQKDGKNVVKLSGSEMMQLVKGVESDSIINKKLLKSIISAPLDLKITDTILTTLLYSVTHVIGGYIQKEILKSNSFKIEINTNFGHTFGQSDSARYKQLGNAVAVPVVKWIIERIVNL